MFKTCTIYMLVNKIEFMLTCGKTFKILLYNNCKFVRALF